MQVPSKDLVKTAMKMRENAIGPDDIPMEALEFLGS